MCNADCGIGGVYVLTAATARTICIYAQVFSRDLHMNGFVDFRRDKDACKGGMSSLCLVERRNSHQPVDADFAGEQAVRILAVNAECRRLDAGLFTGLVIVE